MRSEFWNRPIPAGRISRRRLVGGAATVGLAAAAAGLAGCSSSNTSKTNTGVAATAPAVGQSTAAARGIGTVSAATRAAAATSPTPATLDSTRGKPGGKLVMQGPGYPGGIVLVKTNNSGIAHLASFTHSGLLEFKNGVVGVDGTDISVQPDLATAMPETPDGQTYVFKLRQARFHNGRQVVAADVKYSLERYAFGSDSAYKPNWTWLDSVDTPDAQTAVVHTKAPYADALQSMAARNDAFILAKEWEEGPDAANKLMGSGAFLFVDTTPPVQTSFRKNPDYFNKPYPYFDEVTNLGNADVAKKIADFSSHQVQMSYWHTEDEADQIKKARPDALEFRYAAPAHQVIPRTDQPPLNDKRVRQALSMALDRKALRDVQTKGAGEDDQFLSISAKYWGFRRPADLGDPAKYWKYDPQAAKQLLAAAGITQPLNSDFLHWDAVPIGQTFVDVATLIESQWKQGGIANVNDNTISIGQSTTTLVVGNYNGMALYVNGTPINPTIGIALRAAFFSPPEGVTVPTLNVGHTNDPQLNPLLDKQLSQLNQNDRKQTFRQIEDILAEQQYRITLSTYFYNYFGDPSVKNMNTPREAYNGGEPYIKYWWFA